MENQNDDSYEEDDFEDWLSDEGLDDSSRCDRCGMLLDIPCFYGGGECFKCLKEQGLLGADLLASTPQTPSDERQQ